MPQFEIGETSKPFYDVSYSDKWQLTTHSYHWLDESESSQLLRLAYLFPTSEISSIYSPGLPVIKYISWDDVNTLGSGHWHSAAINDQRVYWAIHIEFHFTIFFVFFRLGICDTCTALSSPWIMIIDLKWHLDGGFRRPAHKFTQFISFNRNEIDQLTVRLIVRDEPVDSFVQKLSQLKCTVTQFH